MRGIFLFHEIRWIVEVPKMKFRFRQHNNIIAGFLDQEAMPQTNSTAYPTPWPNQSAVYPRITCVDRFIMCGGVIRGVRWQSVTHAPTRARAGTIIQSTQSAHGTPALNQTGREISRAVHPPTRPDRPAPRAAAAGNVTRPTTLVTIGKQSAGLPVICPE